SDVGDGPEDSIVITDASHPLAAGLAAGMHAIANSPILMRYGVNLGAGVTVVAEDDDNAALKTIFAYEAGAALFDGSTAAGRRVGLFVDDFGTSVLNDDGLALFDAAILWAKGEDGGGGEPNAAGY